ncbi:GNAT family N-acetyltransferase [Clostridium sp.]|uniref:GNAT family N-acetyltransferase n=1 Tax=Clostridium sp. TaxID=1506 RepID=UPI003216F97C
MSFKIKRFNELTTNELYKILRARSEVFVVEQTCIYQDCDNKDYNAYHLYLEEDNEVIAYLRILDKGISYDEISIGRVLVKNTHRNKGLSRATMVKAISFIEEKLKTNEIRISGQVYLREFYKSLGFKEVSAEYLEDDIPHVEMLYKK